MPKGYGGGLKGRKMSSFKQRDMAAKIRKEKMAKLIGKPRKYVCKKCGKIAVISPVTQVILRSKRKQVICRECNGTMAKTNAVVE
jgi:RNase P subunit RPR2